jgi:hypothetical protein
MRATARCQELGDGSGNVIVELPSYLLEANDMDVNGVLSVELIAGALVLRTIRDAEDTQSLGSL